MTATATPITPKRSKLESIPRPADVESREREILAALDKLFGVFDSWQADPKAPDVPTRDFELALLNAYEVCENGDIPGSCREICVVSMPRLKHEWNLYEGGERRGDGNPLPRFWAAFEALTMSRKGAKPFVPTIPPPVKELLDVQEVTPEQVAYHIWGRNRKGPFVQDNGTPDHVKLRKEADNPGSVIPDGWIPPWEEARRDAWNSITSRRIVAIGVANQDEIDHVDPTPVEDHLRNGQSPSVIAKIKKISVDEVLKVAKEKGIAIPGEPVKPTTTPAVTQTAKPEDSKPATPPETKSNMNDLLGDDHNALSHNGLSGSGLSDRIISMVSREMGVPEIVAELKGEGVSVSTRQVQEIIRKAGGA